MLDSQTKWEGSEDLDDKTGIATFDVGHLSYEIKLENFQDFCAIAEIIDVAYQQGRQRSAKEFKKMVDRMLLELDAIG